MAKLPSIYEHMAVRQKYNMMVYTSYTIVTIIYVSIGLVGYWAYGLGTLSPVYFNFCVGDSVCSLSEKFGIYFVVFLVTIHVMMSYAINMNPVERFVR